MNTFAQKLIIPIAIIIAGGLVAGAIFMTQSKPKTPSVTDVLNTKPEITVAPVSNSDHIRGKKDAKIVIIDYSDTECPFCKSFHESLKKIFDEYGANNTVAWVYRSFPLDIHKKAPKEAEALECAAELGGNEGFWKYTDEIYRVTTSNDTLDLAQLPVIAENVGLNKAAFTTCIDSGKYAAKVDADYEAGRLAGANGTPYTVLVVNGEYIPLVDEQGRGLGALPYTSLKSIIESFLK
jgi:protein-disulfide isomerase